MSVQYFGTKFQMHQRRCKDMKEKTEKKQRSMKRFIKRVLIYLSFLSAVVSASCLIYIVQWLEALRKGWLV